MDVSKQKFKDSCLKIIRYVFIALAAFLTTVSLTSDREIVISNADTFFASMNGTSVAAFFLFIIFCYLYNKVLKIKDNRISVLAAIGGIIFAVIEWLGFNVSKFDYFHNGPENAYQTLSDIFIILGLAMLFYSLLSFLFHFLQTHKIENIQKREYRLFGANLKSFLLLAAIFFTAWLVYYIAYYPGLICWDAYTQIAQGYGYLHLIDHHPVLHTLMMSGIVSAGQQLFGSIADGVGLFVIVQMLFLAFVYSFALFYMAKRNISIIIRVITTVYFAANPLFGLFSITLGKDCWISAFILLYVIYLIEICINRENFFKSKWRLVCFAGIILGMLFLKNTGLYIFIISLPFIFLAAKKYWKPILVVSVACIAVFGVVKGPVFNNLGIAVNQSQEPYTVPLQQIARIVKYNGNDLTDQQKNTINEVLPYNELPDLYVTWMSDPIKAALDVEAFESDKFKYFDTWLELVKEHPKTALMATLANNYGYWYPETNYFLSGEPLYYQGSEIFISRGLPKFDPMVGKNSDQNYLPAVRDNAQNLLNSTVRKIPVLSMLYSLGFQYWILFICALICILKKRWKMLLPFIVLFATWLINLASPMYAEFRYASSAFICVPILIAFTVQTLYRPSKSICGKEKGNN